MQAHSGTAASHGSTSRSKTEQAAEDAMALGLRMVAGQHIDHLPPGPVWDLPRNETVMSNSESDSASRAGSPQATANSEEAGGVPKGSLQ